MELETSEPRGATGTRSGSSTGAAGATVADIRIEGLRTRTETAYIFITGRLINDSDYPTGVQVKTISYDSQGEVLTVSDSWPASISNIPAHSDYPFETMLDHLPGHSRIEMRVIDVRQWD
ncbi:MAG: hypothetical protein ABIE42_03030 [Candidatus Eisenbacteria bacterium]